jgi:hypothetical protein
VNQDQRASLLSSLATRVACTVCHHEAHDAREHHGNHRLDMHHAPVLGPVPLRGGYGHTIGWWYAREAVSWYAWFQHPDGREEVLRRWPDGGSEAVTLDAARADSYRLLG